VQGFFAVVRADSAWRPGQRRSYYFHSFFADPSVSATVRRQLWQLPPPPRCQALCSLPCPGQPWRLALTPVAAHVPPQVTCSPFAQSNPGVLCLSGALAPLPGQRHRVAIT
jgi:hypothetical protein